MKADPNRIGFHWLYFQFTSSILMKLVNWLLKICFATSSKWLINGSWIIYTTWVPTLWLVIICLTRKILNCWVRIAPIFSSYCSSCTLLGPVLNNSSILIRSGCVMTLKKFTLNCSNANCMHYSPLFLVISGFELDLVVGVGFDQGL